MNRLYDRERRRLVWIGERADERFWDARWRDTDVEAAVRRHDTLVASVTRRHVAPGARVLEGGCGRGDKVHTLDALGYEAWGVDFAAETVARVRRVAPHLRVSLGDVRRLEFADEYFDAYWSLGVIEHFYDGYDEIRGEMLRVLKPGGSLFLTVPSMSWLRRRFAARGRYPEFRETDDARRRFYQFALEPRAVISDFEDHGFRLVETKPLNGLLGVKDEAAVLRRLFESRRLPSRVARRILNALVTPFAYHAMLYVLRKLP